MPYIILFVLSFLLVACTPTDSISPTTPNNLPSTEQTSDIDDLKIAPENTIVGEYTLKQGDYSYGSIHQEITEGYLVIEEIDVDNYGYYYVTIVNDMSPETHSGIFYEKGGKFLQKVIYDEEESNGVKPEITTIDNIKITYDENILKIVIDSNKKMSTVWERDDGIAEKSDKMKEALKEAKYEYYKYYKEKCTDLKVKCADHEYTKVVDE